MRKTSKTMLIIFMCLTLAAIAFGLDFIVRDEHGEMEWIPKSTFPVDDPSDPNGGLIMVPGPNGEPEYIPAASLRGG